MMFKKLTIGALLQLSSTPATAAAATADSNSNNLPIVDLGYNLQRATAFNETGNFYSFSNIRYAAPPVGNSRFRAPQEPAVDRDTVQDGSKMRICPQAVPRWITTTGAYIYKYLEDPAHFNISDIDIPPSSPTVNPDASEDCLFLDVAVPKNIFEKRGKGCGAPVFVWIHGGGYTLGNKFTNYDPAGLVTRSQDKNGGIIHVSLNYRLGAFGWLSGKTFQQHGSANAGLLDQRFALEWVQKHIHKFGGDPRRVTVGGESAGGGSIMHQITAYGGRNNNQHLFRQAVIQSPGFLPLAAQKDQEDILRDFLKAANVSSVDDARKLPSEQLVTANSALVFRAVNGSFTFGPAVDGSFVPALPGQLLARGQFNQHVKLMIGHNQDEGLYFTPPYISNNKDFNEHTAYIFPDAEQDVQDYINSNLYPPVFDGSQAAGYRDQISRSAALTSESIFTCNTFYLNKAFHNESYSYQFSVSPALHGDDVPYTYYNGPSPAVQNDTVAHTLQDYIINFAQKGDPNGPAVPHFPQYKTGRKLINLNTTAIVLIDDETANERCNWWQKALYA